MCHFWAILTRVVPKEPKKIFFSRLPLETTPQSIFVVTTRRSPFLSPLMGAPEKAGVR